MGNSKMCSASCGGLFWWMTLLVAVLAVPSAGIIVTNMVPFGGGTAEVLVFILACWLCTYLGMRLMQNPQIAEKMNMDKE